MLSGCVLWLRADLGITQAPVAVLNPNNLAHSDWAPVGLSSRTATTITEDSSTNIHTVTETAAQLGTSVNHPYHVKVGLPPASGNGRYVMVYSGGGAEVVKLDLQSGIVVSTAGGVSNAVYAGGVLDFDAISSSGPNIYVSCWDGSSGISYTGNGVRTCTVGDNGLGAYVTITQGLVSAWADQSGSANNFLQSATVDFPEVVAGAYNGQPCVRGGDTSDHLEHATSVSLGTAATLFVVMKQGSLSNNYVTADAAGANGIISRFTPGLVEWFNGSGADRYTFASSPGGANIYTLRQTNGSALQGWVNGTSAFGPVVPAAALTNIKSLLALYTGTNGSANQDLLEVIAYTNSKGDSERQLVERKLGARYGIAVA